MADADISTTMEAAAEKPAPASSLLPDPGQLWMIFRRRLLPFAAAALVVIGLVLTYVLVQTPTYEATSSVVIEPRKTDVIDINAVVSGLNPETNVIDTEVQILSSRTLAGRVAKALQIWRWPEYALPPSVDPNDPKLLPGTHPLAGRLQYNVTIRRAGLSFVITITARASDPELAALIANEYARQYIAQQSDTKNQATRQASQFLQARLDKMRDEVVSADQAVQNYKIAHGLMSAEGSTMAEQEVSTLNQQIAAARADVAEKEGRLAAARGQIGRGGGGQDVGAALSSGTVSTLRTREAETTQRLADLTTRYGELHPDVRKAKQELADVRAQLQLEINRIISSLSAEAQAAQSRLNSLTGSQSAAKGALASNSAAQVGMLDLDRKAEAARTIYTAFLNRSKETMSQEGMLQPDARIDSFSRVPVLPVSPNIPLAIVFGMAAALICGFAAVALAEYIDGRIRTKTDIERRLRVRYAGAIPELSSTLNGIRNNDSPEDYLLTHPFSAFAEAFRGLRAVLMVRGGTMPGVVAITSALPREGKSTTSIGLARTLAVSGLRTVLVDCDIRRRSTSETLLPPNSNGLFAYLDGSATLDQALVKDALTDLNVLGTTVPPDSARDLFGDRQLATFLAQLRQRFDVIILDTAPVLGIAETRAIAAAADTVLMLARWRKTSIKAADAAVELLMTAQVKLRGVALTMVDIRKYASTGHEDVYSYHKKFAGYYTN
jgi:capsular exopolysaccharide synthesis family protein